MRFGPRPVPRDGISGSGAKSASPNRPPPPPAGPPPVCAVIAWGTPKNQVFLVYWCSTHSNLLIFRVLSRQNLEHL